MKIQPGNKSPKKVEEKRDLLTRNVMKEMQEENVHTKVAEEMKRYELIEKKVGDIVNAQN